MPEVGEFVTSLDMAGCSLTITWLDEELEKFWCAPSDSMKMEPCGLHWGVRSRLSTGDPA